MAFIAGAFDHFRDAQAAADEMRHSGLAARDVRVTNNPANPDGVPCASVREEAEAFRGILWKKSGEGAWSFLHPSPTTMTSPSSAPFFTGVLR